MVRFILSVIVTSCVVSVSATQAATILETATPGGSFSSGIGILESQWVAARFAVDKQTRITNVGGNIGGSVIVPDPNTLFAAIIGLDGQGGFPVSGIEDAVAHTVFEAPSSPPTSAELTIPFSANLEPGDYALVFGTGFFGATGQGYLPGINPVNLDQASLFTWLGGATGFRRWDELAIPPDGLTRRFVVEGFAVPEPSSAVLLCTLALSCLFRLGIRYHLCC